MNTNQTKKLEEIMGNFSEPIMGKVTLVASKSFYDEGVYYDRELLVGDKKD